MKLASTSEYWKDQDYIKVMIYVEKDGGGYSVKKVKSGTCECRSNGTVLETVSFDKSYGNSDGSFNIIFNHPVSISPQVYVSVILDDDTELNAISTTYVVEKPDSPLAKNY